MVPRVSARVVAFIVAPLTAIVFAAPASATQRYASPSGSGIACSQESPCDLQTAIGSASANDEVIVAPGDYGPESTPIASDITTPAQISIHGTDGQPRPRLFTSAVNGLLLDYHSSIRDFEIRHTGTGTGLYVGGPAERVVVRTGDGTACRLADGATIRNSFCQASGLGFGVMLYAQSPAILIWTATLRNVTAVSSAGNAIQVSAFGDQVQLTINATNVIAQGGGFDVSASASGSLFPIAAVNLSHSNFSTTHQAGGMITPPGSGTNQTPEPVFASAATGDLHQLAGSPTIDAGITDAANGTADTDGEARAQGASTDIGADEYPPPSPAPTPTAPDKTKPVASGLNVVPDLFAAFAGRGPSVLASRKKPRRGATVRYRLSEPATVSFTFERAVKGRKKGRRCVPRRHKGRPCVRYRRLRGSFTDSGKAGGNSFRFSGRLKRKPLKPARYRLVGTPRDAAGNRGKAVRTKFRIVKR